MAASQSAPVLTRRHKVDTMKKHAQELLDSVLKNPDVTPERIGRVRRLCLINCPDQWRRQDWSIVRSCVCCTACVACRTPPGDAHSPAAPLLPHLHHCS